MKEKIKNKKGFIRLLEVVVASMLLLGLLNWMSEEVYTPSFELKTNPIYKGISIIDLMHNSRVLETLLENYDLQSIDSEITYLLPVRTPHKIEVTYASEFKIKELNGENLEKNYGITYNFPTSVDKNSIFLSEETKPLERNVLWNSYEIIFSIRNNRTSNLVKENITLLNIPIIIDNGNILSNDSFAFFIKNEEVPMSVDNLKSLNGKWNNVSANITFQIPFLKAGESVLSYLFYSDNTTIFNNSQNYQELTNKKNENYVKILKLTSKKSSRGDVLFKTKLNSYEEKKILLQYSLNTKKSNTYSNIITINNTGVRINLTENNVKEGTLPLYTSLPTTTTYSISRIIPLKQNLAEIKIYLWYI